MDSHEPPTEPLPNGAPVPAPPAPAEPVPAEPSAPTPPPATPFAETRYRFTTGLRAGEIAPVRAEDGRVLLSYRSFASVVGIVAALVTGIVLVAGIAAVAFLAAEGALLRAGAALVLTLVFAFFIALLVPRVNVTLYDEHHPALTLSQRSVFPTATYVVASPNGTALAELRKSSFSRLGRNRWVIVQNGRWIGEASEESLGRALVRKLLGKFSRNFETNVAIEHGGIPVGRVVRRPENGTPADVLELTSDALDRRVAVALATLILGREP